MTTWIPVRIPEQQYKQISHLINKHKTLGYTNEHEFIRDAVREKIAKILVPEVAT